ncbi:dolichyl-diphosphooligosaccharide--protein glycosyltransferase subunit 1-like [Amblyraja radiata]|uniref:dolichyl-diphosphooligosaccharide--protein glycosyltransferase subunit 1-like n=1 Tax=Amblyraja radiata TaxID=386614 RepID=UPI0014036A43|nr:dolichyl-diphosphooligosaccharide--protein glycosyltransferase subunit 1-like [Amblyraja radiata]
MSIMEQVLTLVNKHLGLYCHFEEAVNKYQQFCNIGSLNSGRKMLETEHPGLSGDIASLQSKLKAEVSDLAEKVAEIQKLDCQVKDLALKASQEAERLVAGKVKKDAYIVNHKHLCSKQQDLVSRIDTILDDL